MIKIPPEILSVIVWLTIITLLIFGLFRLFRLEERWEKLEQQKNDEWQTWLKNLAKDIQQRLTAESDTLKRDIETLADANQKGLEHFLQMYDRRLGEVEKRSPSLQTR